MNEYWKMMTGAGSKNGHFKMPDRKKEKEPEERRELSVPEEPSRPRAYPSPHGVNPTIADEIDRMVLDQRALRRLEEAAQTGETIVEMREVVARSSGRINARSVEVSLTFGEKLSLGELLKGCLSIMDYTRRGFGRAIQAIPVPPMRPEPLMGLPPLADDYIQPPPVKDAPFRVIEPRHRIGQKKA